MYFIVAGGCNKTSLVFLRACQTIEQVFAALPEFLTSSRFKLPHLDNGSFKVYRKIVKKDAVKSLLSDVCSCPTEVAVIRQDNGDLVAMQICANKKVCRWRVNVANFFRRTMSCESTLGEQSTFSEFIKCWCQHRQAPPSEKQQWAYYWAWQSHNWFETLVFLSGAPRATVLTTVKWWDLDPTPSSAEEVSVSPEVWEEKLNPANKPWERYENICTQFSDGEAAPHDELLDILGEMLGGVVAPAPPQREIEESKFSCSICVQDIGDAQVYNYMRRDLLESLAEQGVHPVIQPPQFIDEAKQSSWISSSEVQSAITTYQVERGGTPGKDEDGNPTMTFDPTNIHTAEFIRQVAHAVGKSFEWVKHDVLLFLSNPSHFQIERGPIVHGACEHGYHDDCIFRWYQMQRSEFKQQQERAGIYPFAKLRRVNQEQRERRLQPRVNPALGPFACPVCRGSVKSVYVSPQEPAVRLAADYNTELSQPTDAEWGPYRLLPNSLVWVYPTGHHLGGPFAGYLGILRGFRNNSSELKCSFGGCATVELLVPRLPPKDFPISAVFDASFLELDMLPTRQQLGEEFIHTLGIYFLTDPLGYGDLALNWNAASPDERAALRELFQGLQSAFTDRSLRAELQTLLDNHRRHTESALARSVGADVRLNVDEFIRLVARHSGYYIHEPPIVMEPRHFPGSSFVDNLQQLTEDNPALQNMRVHPIGIRLFMIFASAGYDIMPDQSAVLLPILRTRYPALPSALQPLPDRPIELLPLSEPAAKKKESKGKRKESPSPAKKPKKHKKEHKEPKEEQKEKKPRKPRKPKEPKEKVKKPRKPRKPKEEAAASSAPPSALSQNAAELLRRTTFLNRPTQDYVTALLALEGVFETMGFGMRNHLLTLQSPEIQDTIVNRLVTYLLSF